MTMYHCAKCFPKDTRKSTDGCIVIMQKYHSSPKKCVLDVSNPIAEWKIIHPSTMDNYIYQWDCPSSPTGKCHYSKNLDHCDYCNKPERRLL